MGVTVFEWRLKNEDLQGSPYLWPKVSNVLQWDLQVGDESQETLQRLFRDIADISEISRTSKVLYSTITFNINFAKYFVAKLRLLEFALHQDVVTNCFDRRLIQNIADITSKCVARLQNAAIPITKCRNRYHKMRRYCKMTSNTNFCCLSVFAHF